MSENHNELDAALLAVRRVFLDIYGRHPILTDEEIIDIHDTVGSSPSFPDCMLAADDAKRAVIRIGATPRGNT